MNKNQKIFLVSFISLFLATPSFASPFKGENKNIKWVSNTPDEFVKNLTHTQSAERSQVDVGEIDLDGDGQDETIKVIWSREWRNHALTIEIYKDNELIETLKNDFGYQPNYKIENIDEDKMKEIIIWSGRWDFRTPGADGIAQEDYEGLDSPHKYIVATYKWIQGGYSLWDIYTTKNQYDPYVEEQPRE